MDVEITRSSVLELKRLAGALMLDHARESEMPRPDPNWELYETLERQDMVVCHLVRPTGSDEPVGYQLTVVGPGMQYREERMATNEVVYVDPAYRCQGLRSTVVRLMAAAIHDCRELGATQFAAGASPGSPLEQLLGHESKPLGNFQPVMTSYRLEM